MTKILFSLILILFALGVHAEADECWSQVLPGHYSPALKCAYQDWQKSPDHKHLTAMLNLIYRVYFVDGHNPHLKRFFAALRSNDLRLNEAMALRLQLVERYRDWNSANQEPAAYGLLPRQDARMLFILSAVDPSALPVDVAASVHLTVYSDLETAFLLQLAPTHEPGVFPRQEYARLLEIYKRMSWHPDPYFKAINQYYKGITEINLGRHLQGMLQVWGARELLKGCLASAKQQLSRKRILYALADASLVLRSSSEAEGYYISILKMDPQDWNAMMSLSRVLNLNGKCSEDAIWVEASAKSQQQFYEIVVHCGSREIPEEELEPSIPVIALLNSL
jgi:hypothetical protein